MPLWAFLLLRLRTAARSDGEGGNGVGGGWLTTTYGGRRIMVGMSCGLGRKNIGMDGPTTGAVGGPFIAYI